MAPQVQCMELLGSAAALLGVAAEVRLLGNFHDVTR